MNYFLLIPGVAIAIVALGCLSAEKPGLAAVFAVVSVLYLIGGFTGHYPLIAR